MTHAEARPHGRAIEVWAGVECARVRVGDDVCDELDLTGHASRVDDIDRIASLGVSAVRYPVLWERTEVAPGEYDWRWADERLGRLGDLGISPIVGLLHHGTGPRWAPITSDGFPGAFAAFAGAFARRYPTIDRYLPINEPLTTARFAGLYGHWWPHGRDWGTFARLLLAQVLATRAAMEAVREVNAVAQLIQNEDLGFTFSTPEVADQARFDNERRWLTFDLLAGRVASGHPMFHALTSAGQSAHLASLRQRPCPPDLIGVDYYVTSDRFLDHRIERYPESARGGNDRARYADVEAVRSMREWTIGFGRAIDEACERYGLPVALTEVQLAAGPRDQRAWWAHAWHEAAEARARGRDVLAVTAWSAFGAWEWPSLLRRRDGIYEPGPFDARTDPPSETLLAHGIRRIAARTKSAPSRPRFGWWQRPERLLYAVDLEDDRERPSRTRARSAA